MDRLDVVFYRGKGPVSWLIKQKTNSEFSHCGIVVDGKILVDTDWWHDYRIHELNWPDELYEMISIPFFNEDKATEFILSNLGRQYDLWEIFRYLSGYGADDQDRFNCVEAVFDFLEYIGIDLPGDRTSVYSPGELYEIINTH